MSTATSARARWLIFLVPAFGIALAVQLVSDNALDRQELPALGTEIAASVTDLRDVAAPRTEIPGRIQATLRGSRNATRRVVPSSGLSLDVARATVHSHIEGVVQDEDARVIPGAHVSLRAMLDARTPHRSALLEATTDANGSFCLSPVPAGVYAVWAEAEGRAPAWRAGITAGARVELELGRGGRLSVATLDAAGQPIEGARVRVRRPGYFRDEATDGEGLASFTSLPGGPVELRATTEGGGLYSSVVHIDPDEPRRLQCTLAPASVVHGMVHARGTTRGIADAVVRLRLLDHPDLEASETRTGRNGAFELRVPMAEGTRLEARVSKEGFADGIASLRPPLEGADDEPLVITLWPQQQIEGRVVDERGRAMARASVWWPVEGDPDSSGANRAVSDSRGRFYIALPAGTTDRGSRTIAARAPDGRLGATAVAMSAPTDELHVVVRGIGHVAGTITDASGDPWLAAQVVLEPSSMGVSSVLASSEEAWARRQALACLEPAAFSAQSEERGGFLVPAVPTGDWRVRVTHSTGTLVLPEPIVVAANEVQRLDIVIPGPAGIFGEVISSVGSPICGAHVLATSSAGMEATWTDARGRFTLADLDGRVAWTLRASAPAHAVECLESVFTGSRAVRIVMSDRPAVHGTVICDGRAYDARFRIHLVPARFVDVGSGESIGSVPLDHRSSTGEPFANPKGSFEVDLPDDRVYFVQAVSQDGSLASAPQILTGRHGHEPAHVTLELMPAGRTQGRVVSVAGTPAAGAIVTVHAYVDGAVVAHPVASARTDTRGVYALGPLPTGLYHLRVADAQGQTTTDVALPASRELMIRM